MTTGALLRERAQALWPAAAVIGGAAVGLAATRIATPLIVVVALLGLLGALAVLAAPEIGLLALVFASYLNLSDVLLRRFGGPFSLMDLLVPLLTVAVLVQCFWQRRTLTDWQRPALLVAAYGLAGVLSLFAALDSGSTLEGLMRLAKDGLVVILAVILIQRAATLRRVLWALLAAGMLMATISVHQHMSGNFGSDYWGLAAEPVSYVASEGVAHRVVGPIGDPNYYGMILLVLVPIAVDRFSGSRGFVARVLALAALVVCSLAIVFTYSRGALVALLIMVALLTIVRRPRPRHLLAALAVAALLSPLVPGAYVQRMETVFEKMGTVVSTLTRPSEAAGISDSSFRGRLSENMVAVRMFLDYPLTGIGLDNYPSRYQDYSQEILLDPRSGNRAPHSLYLEIASETGLAGLVAFGIILWVLIRGIVVARRSLSASELADVRGMVDAVGIAFSGWLLASLFLHATNSRYFWLLVGIALALPRVAENEAAAVSQLDDGLNPSH